MTAILKNVFKKDGASLLEKTLGVIDKAVVDKDEKARLQHEAVLIHLESQTNARSNQSTQAKWVRAILAVLLFFAWAGANYIFIDWIMGLEDVSMEVKISFAFKILSDIGFMLTMSLTFYYGSSDETSKPNLDEIRKNMNKLK